MKKLLYISGLIVLTASSCKKDDDDVTNPPSQDQEQENITSLELTFTEIGIPSNTFTVKWADPDGDGGNNPVIDDIMLDNAVTYSVDVRVLDESDASDIDDLTPEIEAEDDEHLFCFTPSNTNISITRTDSDGTYEVGLDSEWAVNSTGSGDVTIQLKHQPNGKDGTCTPGETDIQVTFPFTIQ